MEAQCRVGCRNTAHYLDYYLFGGERSTGRCQFILETFQSMVDELGLPLAEKKTEGPATSLIFLDIELDTIQQTSRLPQDKLVSIRNIMQSLKGRKEVTLKELQEIVGHLNFAWKVVTPGRAFVRRLCNAMS